MAQEVFISYSSKDKPIADAVCANIEAAGIRCWIAPRDIQPGEDWPSAIANAISTSKLMVLIFSSESNRSKDVGRELYLAADGGVTILPFKLDNIEPEPGKRYYLARTHWLDAMNPPTEEQIQLLVSRVKVILGGEAEEKLSRPKTAVSAKLERPVPAKNKRKTWPAVGGIGLLLLAILGLAFFTNLPSGLNIFFAGTKTAAVEASPTVAVNVPTPTSTAEPVRIRWFTGLSNDNTGKADSYRQVVQDFNASHDNIELVLEAMPFDSAAVSLSNRFSSQNGPDIIGPQFQVESNPFLDEWLDLSPYMDQLDTTPFSPLLMSLSLYPQGQLGLPYQIRPAMMYYNLGLFDKAGLNYPPAKYGENYLLDGKPLSWDWDTVALVGQRLTLDANGRHAGENGFDKNKIVQYGFTWVWGRDPVPFFGGGQPGNTGSGSNQTAHLSAGWEAAWKWTYEGMWGKTPFILPDSRIGDFNLSGNANTFSSGKVGMTVLQAWYSCCLEDFVSRGNSFDLGVIPSFSNQTHLFVEDFSFRIWRGSSHPQEALEVMYWMSTIGVIKLPLDSPTDNSSITYWHGLAALTSAQADYIAANHAAYPGVTHWEVAAASANYPDLAYSQTYLPNSKDVENLLVEFGSKLRNTPGLNLDNEFDKLQNSLTELFNK